MKSILIREIPESTLAALKKRAARHHRSLQKEIVRLLEDGARMVASGNIEEKRELKLFKVKQKDSGTWSRDSIYGDEGR